jgi:hypothetical protein
MIEAYQNWEGTRARTLTFLWKLAELGTPRRGVAESTRFGARR